MEKQKTTNSQSDLEKEKQGWRNKAPWLYYKVTVIMLNFEDLGKE